jgi:hypothetical protein
MATLNSESKTYQACLSSVLARLLAHTKISSNFLAKEINLPPPTIHRILTGDVQDPRASTLSSIADYFSISIDQLLGKKDLDADFYENGETFKPPLSIPVLSIAEAKEYKKHLVTPANWLRWLNKDKSVSNQPITHMFSILLKNNIYDPPFSNETYLIVNPDIEPDSGDYVLISFKNDPNAVIKKYISEGTQKYLYPLKQDLKSIPLDKDDCSLIGVVAETYLKLKP